MGKGGGERARGGGREGKGPEEAGVELCDTFMASYKFLVLLFA